MRHLSIFISVLMTLPVQAQERLLGLPLEDLLQIEISSASRKVQSVQEVAAAVFVISREEIARSGARSIPEALRLAPGVEVARIGNNSWAVSIRGFNGRFANKLLVLKDGRNVYSSLYSGVLWEAEDALLSDIERIEVIRGPGAAMWGANAVNGVINIISRHTADTLGTEVSVATASDEPGAVSLRHGFALGEGHWRLSAKGFDQSAARSLHGEPGNDGWKAGRLGLRGDWPADPGGRWMLVGEVYQSRAGNRLEVPGASAGAVAALTDITQTNDGGNLSLRREQSTADGGQWDWQLSAEHSDLNLQTLIREDRDTVSAEFQRRQPLGAHEVLWGASYRYSRDHIELPPQALPAGTTFEQDRRVSRTSSVFVHGDFELVPERLLLSGGLRLGHDNWSGRHVQPDVRLAWTPDVSTTWWTSLARAVRTPSRLELDGVYGLGETAARPPFVPAVRVIRQPPAAGTLKAEVVTALEAGFRQRVNAQVSLDIAAFVSDYSDLVSTVTQPLQLVSPSLAILPLSSNNAARARTHGFELAADWLVSSRWRLQPNYTRLYLRSPRLDDPAASLMQDQLEGRVPRHRASLRSSWTLDDGAQLDLWLKYTSRLSNPAVPAYSVLDLRYARRIGRYAELALVGQNLLSHRHTEFVSDYLPMQQTAMGRSLQIKGTWQF